VIAVGRSLFWQGLCPSVAGLGSRLGPASERRNMRTHYAPQGAVSTSRCFGSGTPRTHAHTPTHTTRVREKHLLLRYCSCHPSRLPSGNVRRQLVKRGASKTPAKAAQPGARQAQGRPQAGSMLNGVPGGLGGSPGPGRSDTSGGGRGAGFAARARSTARAGVHASKGRTEQAGRG